MPVANILVKSRQLPRKSAFGRCSDAHCWSPVPNGDNGDGCWMAGEQDDIRARIHKEGWNRREGKIIWLYVLAFPTRIVWLVGIYWHQDGDVKLGKSLSGEIGHAMVLGPAPPVRVNVKVR